METIPDGKTFYEEIIGNELLYDTANLYITDYEIQLRNACETYYLYLKELIISKIKYEIENYYKTSSSIKTYFRIFIPLHNETISFNRFRIDVLHYGPFITGMSKYWTNRNSEFWTKIGIEPPFVRIQKEFARKNYFIYDLSDPKLSFQPHIIIFIGKRYIRSFDYEQLWHHLDIIDDNDYFIIPDI